MPSQANPETLPKSSALCAELRRRGQAWLSAPEGQQVVAAGAEDRDLQAVKGYLHDVCLPVDPSWTDIAEKVVVGYLNVGTAAGAAFRNHSLTQLWLATIAREELADMQSDDLVHLGTSSFVNDHPVESAWLLRLLNQHAQIARAVIRDEFKSDILRLRRGVIDPNLYWPIESWVFAGPTQSYGPIELEACVPLQNVLSLRCREHEILVARRTLDHARQPIRPVVVTGPS